MLLTIILKGKKFHRSVNRRNITKVAKSIQKEFPDSDYASLHAIIWNGIQKDKDRLTIVVREK